ncbi:MAG: YebC/PmpR family DNA-binding transcriptional regulator [Lacunisphaera sp.]|nr:YebC/PmpR family DNA-binding transcriptional regulator [Lacunisphaera sp.]
MSGNNKWTKLKRHKAATDARKGKLFAQLARNLTIAARAGGSDAAGNARLRTLLFKAREVHMPEVSIDHAIKKGTGELPGVVFEELHYEGYGPGGVAFIVMVTTDNKQRTAQLVRSVFEYHGGKLALNGAVAFQFLHAGQFLVPAEQAAEDRVMEVALAAGADDILTTGDGYEVRCNLHDFDKVAHALEQAGLKPASAEIAYLPTNLVSITTPEMARALVKLHDALEAEEDVSAVFSNEEIDNALAEAAAAG